MDEVDFSSVASAQEWLEGQTIEVCCAISSRAALRVCASFGELDDDLFMPITLASFHAMLKSAIRGLGRTEDIDWLKGSAAHTAYVAQTARGSNSVSNSVSRANFAAAFAAHAAHSLQFYGYAARSADFAAESASFSSDNSADSHARLAAESATLFDSSLTNLTDYQSPLWAGADVPPVIQDAHERFLDRLNQDRAVWGFWHDWYLAMWEGTFRDWDFATEVAKIPDDVWDEGPEAVAIEIEKIQSKWRKTPVPEAARQEAFEPKSVDSLIANRTIASYQSYNISLNASSMFEEFYRQTGLNRVPKQFAALEAMPASLVRIGEILNLKTVDSSSKQDLLEEVGRLNAKVAALEAALEKLNNAKEPVFAPQLKKQIAASIGDWKLYAALAAGVWMISGDEIGVQKRLENIVNLRESIFGDDCPAPITQAPPSLPRSYET